MKGSRRVCIWIFKNNDDQIIGITLNDFFALCLHLASEKISENLHIVANDPSLAFYRMQEHIRKGEI